MAHAVADEPVTAEIRVQMENSRFAHFQGGGLELLHIGVPVDGLVSGEDEGSEVGGAVQRVDVLVARKNTAHVGRL